MLQDRYRFEAELDDGTLMTEGGDISRARRVSLIPAQGTGLPQHDLMGIQFVRRFMRYFKRTRVGGFDKAAYFAEVERRITPARLASREARTKRHPEWVAPEGEPIKPQKLDECLQVIVTRDYRLYVSHLTGATLTTPPNYEVYL